MDRQRGLSIIGGLLLILLGGWFLAVQFAPGLEGWFNIELSWPLLIIGIGIFLLIFGLIVGAPGMAVPACIVGGIGILLYWQNATGNWETWAYAWALIPGFVGLGVILAGLLEGNIRRGLSDGGSLIIISLVMFIIFGSFLGGFTLLGNYWPVLLIVLGLWMMIRLLLRPRRSVD